MSGPDDCGFANGQSWADVLSTGQAIALPVNGGGHPQCDVVEITSTTWPWYTPRHQWPWPLLGLSGTAVVEPAAACSTALETLELQPCGCEPIEAEIV